MYPFIDCASVCHQVVDIMKGILTGLKTIHDANIVHNDLHPRNILMQKDIPKIGDFGVSREAGCPRPVETTESIKYEWVLEK